MVSRPLLPNICQARTMGADLTDLLKIHWLDNFFEVLAIS